MTTPKMTATIEYPGQGHTTITIEHDIAQSYSRSVDPKAMKVARQTLRGTWALTDVDYGLERAAPRRTASRFHFHREAR